MDLPPSERKADHLRLAADPGVQHTVGTGLDTVRLRHRALPERALDAVSLRVRLLGHGLEAPLVISAMTGGTTQAEELNRRLLRAAASNGVALVLGSRPRPLEGAGAADVLRTYRPDSEGRPPLLLANLGAVQIAGR